ncbi:MAG TPA: hypothetical protein VKZ43_09890 [Trueperaceae bacterium]|nr:hypothetical protein [Trueperaceae bacterium]
MSFLQKLIGASLRPRVRAKARGKSYQDVIVDLETSRDKLMPKLAAAKDTAGNREALNHFAGIERWSLSRIRVAAGAKFELDSYRGYRLPDTAALSELQQAFRDARAESLELAKRLLDEGVDPATTIQHNDLGDLTVIEWFVYLIDHSSREIIRIRT